MSGKTIKIIGISLSIVSMVVNAALNIVNEKRLDNVIAEKVSEAVAKIEK